MRTLLPLLLLFTGCREVETIPDADGDGFSELSDCNDADATVHPGAAELCDGIDQDCDASIDDEAIDGATFYLDGDGDGYGNGSFATTGCDMPAGYIADSSDCNDNDPAFHPGATEADCSDPNDYNCDGTVGYADGDADGFPACQDCNDDAATINPGAIEQCDAADNDCDGITDEAGATGEGTWFNDLDGDGYGNPDDSLTGCDAPAGYVNNDDDCNDSSSEAKPGGIEVCDSLDNDCSGVADDDATDAPVWYADGDSDGYGNAAVTLVTCDAGPGWISDSSDCNDTDNFTFPGASEVCDDVDNNCDGSTDEGLTGTWYADGDDDGFGDPSVSIEGCPLGVGWTADGTDCDDADPGSNPDATESCDDVDNNCDGSTDEGLTATWYADGDGDGFGNAAVSINGCSPGAGWTADGTDCNDGDVDSNPGAVEACDGADNNCDGTADEGLDSRWYLDYDDDGYGDSTIFVDDCIAPSSNFSATDGDCDDLQSTISPGEAPGCNGLDNDCDGDIDNDADGDGYADITCGGDDCDDSNAAIVPELGGGCAVGTSCQAILDAGRSIGDGTYFIDVDGPGIGEPAFDVYCDMTATGEGWSLVRVDDHTDKGPMKSAAAVGTVPSTLACNGSNTKLSDAVIQQMWSGQLRFTTDADVAGDMYIYSDTDITAVSSFSDKCGNANVVKWYFGQDPSQLSGQSTHGEYCGWSFGPCNDSSYMCWWGPHNGYKVHMNPSWSHVSIPGPVATRNYEQGCGMGWVR